MDTGCQQEKEWPGVLYRNICSVGDDHDYCERKRGLKTPFEARLLSEVFDYVEPPVGVLDPLEPMDFDVDHVKQDLDVVKSIMCDIQGYPDRLERFDEDDSGEDSSSDDDEEVSDAFSTKQSVNRAKEVVVRTATDNKWVSCMNPWSCLVTPDPDDGSTRDTFNSSIPELNVLTPPDDTRPGTPESSITDCDGASTQLEKTTSPDQQVKDTQPKLDYYSKMITGFSRKRDSIKKSSLSSSSVKCEYLERLGRKQFLDILVKQDLLSSQKFVDHLDMISNHRLDNDKRPNNSRKEVNMRYKGNKKKR